MPTPQPADRGVIVWDLPTRAFHWLTVALVAAAYATWRLNWMDWHAWCGDALLALLLFRLVWGFVGSDTARFARFLASPRAAAHHIARLFTREPDTQVGHNPAGGWMVLLLLALLLGQTLTGIVDNNDVADAGPLTDIMPAGRREHDRRAAHLAVGRFARRRGAPRRRHCHLRGSEAPQPAAPDADRPQAPAGAHAAAAPRLPGAGVQHPVRQRRGGSAAREHPVSEVRRRPEIVEITWRSDSIPRHPSASGDPCHMGPRLRGDDGV